MRWNKVCSVWGEWCVTVFSSTVDEGVQSTPAPSRDVGGMFAGGLGGMGLGARLPQTPMATKNPFGSVGPVTSGM